MPAQPPFLGKSWTAESVISYDKGTPMDTINKDMTLDCYGLLCPMPIIKITERMKELQVGQVLEIIATDEGIKTDLPAWCKMTGHEFLGIKEEHGEFHAFVKKVKA